MAAAVGDAPRPPEPSAATQPSHDAAVPTTKPFTLSFVQKELEGEYLASEARSRWPVLVSIFVFDVACYALRLCAKSATVLYRSPTRGGELAALLAVGKEMGPQLANMMLLHLFAGLFNRRSRKLGDLAVQQEELLLSACMALAICSLLATVTADNATDYVYAAYFLICTSTFLKIRWWIGTLVLAVPMSLAAAWHFMRPPILPNDAIMHITVAWAVGGLMAYLAEWYRRQMFASQKMAANAHKMELLEAQARIKAQRQLAAAQAQAAHRALSVAREKASNEAKSDFMSLMCHEVRTPLNGCLASAEMLLETPLEEEQRELTKTICVSGSILLSTVSNFLDFFKLEAGKALDVVRTAVDLKSLVSDVHCIIEAMIGRHGDVRLLDPDMGDVTRDVVCDPDRVRGILLNLYTNAAKFTKHGHIELKVSEVTGDFVPAAPEGYHMVTAAPASQTLQRVQDKGRGPQTGSQLSVRVRRSSLGPGAGAGRKSLDQGGSWPLASASPRATGHHTPGTSTPVSLSAHDFHADGGLESPHSNARRSGAQLQEWLADRTLTATAAAPGPAGARALSTATMLNGDSGAGRSGTALPPLASGMFSSVPGSTSREQSGGAADGGADETVAAATRPHSVAATMEGGDAAAAGAARAPSRWLLFEVMDTGIGIGRDGLNALFKEYVQGTDDEMKKPRSKGGTGLGLSICSKQVGVLGGRIGACSSPGKGSVFWFTMPLLHAAEYAASHGAGARSAIFASDGRAAAAPLPVHPPPRVSVSVERSAPRASVSAESSSAALPLPRASVGGEPAAAERHAHKPPQQQPSTAGTSDAAALAAALANVLPSAVARRGPPHAAGGATAAPLAVTRDSPAAPGGVVLHTTDSDSAGSHGARAVLAGGQADEGNAHVDDVCSGVGGRRLPAADGPAGLAGGAAPAAGGAAVDAATGAVSPSPAADVGGHVTGPEAPPPALHGASGAPADAARAAVTTLAGSTTGGGDVVPGAGHSTTAGAASGGAAARAEASPAWHRAPTPEPQRTSGECCDGDARIDVSLRLPMGTSMRAEDAAAVPPATAGLSALQSAAAAAKSDSPASHGQRAAEGAALSAPPAVSSVQGYSLASAMGSAGSSGGGAATGGMLGGTLAGHTSSPRRSHEVFSMRGVRALLVEDNLINQTVARKMLHSLGMQCEVASNGLEAVHAVERTMGSADDGKAPSAPFDVVLMDMSMPVMGGVDATRAIRRLGSSVPILAMTANASDKDRDECKSSGMDGFLSKPVLKDRLADAIEQVMHQQQRSS